MPGQNAAPSDRLAALEAALARSTAELDAVRRRLVRLEDRDAIVNLQRIYGYYLDKALYDELIDLFTDDVSLEYSGRGIYLGRERARQLMAMMPGGTGGLRRGMLQNHIQLQGVVHVDPGGETAHGRWRAFIMMGWPNGTSAWQEGIYENEYRKEGGVWKISKVRFYCNVNADFDEGWARAPLGVPGVSAELPPDLPPSDPAYQPYPAAYVPPFHYPHPVTGR